MTIHKSFNQFIIVFKQTIGHHSLYEITDNNNLHLIDLIYYIIYLIDLVEKSKV